MTLLIKWCHMRALMCHCDRTVLSFSSKSVSYCLFFSLLIQSTSFFSNSLINFFLAYSLFYAQSCSCLVFVALSFSFQLAISSLSLSICLCVYGGLSNSLISVISLALACTVSSISNWSAFNLSLCLTLTSSYVVSLLPSFPLSFSPSLILCLRLSSSPLCALTGLFLSLIVMAGSAALHNAADIFPSRDPTVAAAAHPLKKWTRHPSFLAPNPYFSVSFSSAKLLPFSRGAVQQDWFVLESHWAPAS